LKYFNLTKLFFNYILIQNKKGETKMQTKTKNIALSALFLALGLILPFFTGQIRSVGNLLLPMHLPVLLCGLICGPLWGGAVGLLLPIVRSFAFGMPKLYPMAIGMSFELLAYGAAIGIIYKLTRKNTLGIYISLISSIIIGRIVWGAVSPILYGIIGNAFTFQMFWASAVIKAIPGIILQIILIPAIMLIKKKFENNDKEIK
jgi:predicted membrane protein